MADAVGADAWPLGKLIDKVYKLERRLERYLSDVIMPHLDDGQGRFVRQEIDTVQKLETIHGILQQAQQEGYGDPEVLSELMSDIGDLCLTARQVGMCQGEITLTQDLKRIVAMLKQIAKTMSLMQPPNQGRYPGGDHITPVTSHEVPSRARAPDVIAARNDAHPTMMTRSKSVTLMTHGKSHCRPTGDVTKEHSTSTVDDVRNSCRLRHRRTRSQKMKRSPERSRMATDTQSAARESQELSLQEDQSWARDRRVHHHGCVKKTVPRSWSEFADNEGMAEVLQAHSGRKCCPCKDLRHRDVARKRRHRDYTCHHGEVTSERFPRGTRDVRRLSPSPESHVLMMESNRTEPEAGRKIRREGSPPPRRKQAWRKLERRRTRHNKEDEEMAEDSEAEEEEAGGKSRAQREPELVTDRWERSRSASVTSVSRDSYTTVQESAWEGNSYSSLPAPISTPRATQTEPPKSCSPNLTREILHQYNHSPPSQSYEAHRQQEIFPKILSPSPRPVEVACQTAWIGQSEGRGIQTRDSGCLTSPMTSYPSQSSDQSWKTAMASLECSRVSVVCRRWENLHAPADTGSFQPGCLPSSRHQQSQFPSESNLYHTHFSLGIQTMGCTEERSVCTGEAVSTKGIQCSSNHQCGCRPVSVQCSLESEFRASVGVVTLTTRETQQQTSSHQLHVRGAWSHLQQQKQQDRQRSIGTMYYRQRESGTRSKQSDAVVQYSDSDDLASEEAAFHSCESYMSSSLTCDVQIQSCANEIRENKGRAHAKRAGVHSALRKQRPSSMQEKGCSALTDVITSPPLTSSDINRGRMTYTPAPCVQNHMTERRLNFRVSSTHNSQARVERGRSLAEGRPSRPSMAWLPRYESFASQTVSEKAPLHPGILQLRDVRGALQSDSMLPRASRTEKRESSPQISPRTQETTGFAAILKPDTLGFSRVRRAGTSGTLTQGSMKTSTTTTTTTSSKALETRKTASDPLPRSPDRALHRDAVSATQLGTPSPPRHPSPGREGVLSPRVTQLRHEEQLRAQEARRSKPCPPRSWRELFATQEAEDIWRKTSTYAISTEQDVPDEFLRKQERSWTLSLQRGYGRDGVVNYVARRDIMAVTYGNRVEGPDGPHSLQYKSCASSLGSPPYRNNAGCPHRKCTTPEVPKSPLVCSCRLCGSRYTMSPRLASRNPSQLGPRAFSRSSGLTFKSSRLTTPYSSERQESFVSQQKQDNEILYHSHADEAKITPSANQSPSSQYSHIKRGSPLINNHPHVVAALVHTRRDSPAWGCTTYNSKDEFRPRSARDDLRETVGDAIVKGDVNTRVNSMAVQSIQNASVSMRSSHQSICNSRSSLVQCSDDPTKMLTAPSCKMRGNSFAEPSPRSSRAPLDIVHTPSARSSQSLLQKGLAASPSKVQVSVVSRKASEETMVKKIESPRTPHRQASYVSHLDSSRPSTAVNREASHSSLGTSVDPPQDGQSSGNNSCDLPSFSLQDKDSSERVIKCSVLSTLSCSQDGSSRAAEPAGIRPDQDSAEVYAYPPEVSNHHPPPPHSEFESLASTVLASSKAWREKRIKELKALYRNQTGVVGRLGWMGSVELLQRVKNDSENKLQPGQTPTNGGNVTSNSLDIESSVPIYTNQNQHTENPNAGSESPHDWISIPKTQSSNSSLLSGHEKRVSTCPPLFVSSSGLPREGQPAALAHPSVTSLQETGQAAGHTAGQRMRKTLSDCRLPSGAPACGRTSSSQTLQISAYQARATPCSTDGEGTLGGLRRQFSRMAVDSGGATGDASGSGDLRSGSGQAWANRRTLLRLYPSVLRRIPTSIPPVSTNTSSAASSVSQNPECNGEISGDPKKGSTFQEEKAVRHELEMSSQMSIHWGCDSTNNNIYTAGQTAVATHVQNGMQGPMDLAHETFSPSGFEKLCCVCKENVTVWEHCEVKYHEGSRLSLQPLRRQAIENFHWKCLSPELVKEAKQHSGSPVCSLEAEHFPTVVKAELCQNCYHQIPCRETLLGDDLSRRSMHPSKIIEDNDIASEGTTFEKSSGNEVRCMTIENCISHSWESRDAVGYDLVSYVKINDSHSVACSDICSAEGNGLLNVGLNSNNNSSSFYDITRDADVLSLRDLDFTFEDASPCDWRLMSCMRNHKEQSPLTSETSCQGCCLHECYGSHIYKENIPEMYPTPEGQQNENNPSPGIIFTMGNDESGLTEQSVSPSPSSDTDENYSALDSTAYSINQQCVHRCRSHSCCLLQCCKCPQCRLQKLMLRKDYDQHYASEASSDPDELSWLLSRRLGKNNLEKSICQESSMSCSEEDQFREDTRLFLFNQETSPKTTSNFPLAVLRRFCTCSCHHDEIPRRHRRLSRRKLTGPHFCTKRCRRGFYISRFWLRRCRRQSAVVRDQVHDDRSRADSHIAAALAHCWEELEDLWRAPLTARHCNVNTSSFQEWEDVQEEEVTHSIPSCSFPVQDLDAMSDVSANNENRWRSRRIVTSRWEPNTSSSSDSSDSLLGLGNIAQLVQQLQDHVTQAAQPWWIRYFRVREWLDQAVFIILLAALLLCLGSMLAQPKELLSYLRSWNLVKVFRLGPTLERIRPPLH